MKHGFPYEQFQKNVNNAQYKIHTSYDYIFFLQVHLVSPRCTIIIAGNVTAKADKKSHTTLLPLLLVVTQKDSLLK